MEIDDLRTFVEVADAGGISPAALRLGIAKSIVSRRLVRLESDLGVQLLARTTRGAALTEAGLTFRDFAARICAEMDVARETVLPTGDLRGRLRVSVPLTFGPTHFAPVIAELARCHPQLQIQACYSDRFVDIVAEGFDCAIRVGSLGDSSLVARRVGPISGQLVASPAYVQAHGAPQLPQEILSHEALMQGTESWHFMDGDQVVTVRPRGRFKADNGTALVAAAVAGVGLGYLPDGLTHPFLTCGALVPVMSRFPPRPAGAYVLRPPGPHPARKVRILIDMLCEYLERTPNLVATLPGP